MCNSWNHSPRCTCGWGGNGHLGRSDGGNRAYGGYSGIQIPKYRLGNYSLSQKPFSYESYVNRNAHCRECNASVYFYRSPSGGGVFFDELGPPWPKHSCTNRILDFSAAPTSSSRSKFVQNKLIKRFDITRLPISKPNEFSIRKRNKHLGKSNAVF